MLEHESIALDMPNSYSTFQPPTTYPSKKLSLSVDMPPLSSGAQAPAYKLAPEAVVQPRELPRQRLPESFNLVTPLPGSFPLRSNSAVSLYRARMENRNVILRVLNGGQPFERFFHLP